MDLDNTNLIYHQQRVADWKKGIDIYPLYVEISLTNICNHKCKFCALNFTRGNNFIDYKILAKNIPIMANHGVKSIMFAGEGEPTLNPELNFFIRLAYNCGIDVALTTNGSNVITNPYEYKWIKYSIDAGNKEVHEKIHGSKDWDKIWSNIEYSVKFKGNSTIGVQAVLLPDNIDSIEELCKKCVEYKVDYLVIKPFSFHPNMRDNPYKKINYNKIPVNKWKKIAQFSKTEILFRANAFKALEKRDYCVCRAVPYFWAYIKTDMSVLACSSFFYNPLFNFGSLKYNSFKEIWSNECRSSLKIQIKDFDIAQCRRSCRMNEVNSYLNKISNPPPHWNFI